VMMKANVMVLNLQVGLALVVALCPSRNKKLKTLCPCGQRGIFY